MLNVTRTTKIAYSLALLALVTSQFSLSVHAQGFTLRGHATQDDIYKKQPSLQRNDMNSNSNDAFGGQQEQSSPMLEAAPPSFAIESMLPPSPPPRQLRGSAQDEGNDAFNGMPQQPTLDNAQGKMMQAMPDQMPQQQQMRNPGDPDSSPDMQLAWDRWHHQLAEQIYMRYNKLASIAFRISPPLQASVSYVVTRDGQVGNVRLLTKSSNIMYNTMIMTVINSMNHDPILAFPPGSRRMAVEKSGTFTQNYGNEGFRFLQGDHETVHQR